MAVHILIIQQLLKYCQGFLKTLSRAAQGPGKTMPPKPLANACRPTRGFGPTAALQGSFSAKACQSEAESSQVHRLEGGPDKAGCDKKKTVVWPFFWQRLLLFSI
jgi:hypothetical protein